MTKYYKDYGVSASITEHKDGSATLKVNACGKKTSRKYKNFNSARQAWYRWCN